jgi:hypothetical protein
MPLPVALGVMTAGEIRMETAQSIGVAIADEVIAQMFYVQSGPYLDNGRNEMVRIFRDPMVRERCTHLLMVDSDIAFSNSDIVALYEACEERAVVSGIYYSSFEGTPLPIIYDWTTNSAGLKTLKVIDHWDDGWGLWPRSENREGLDPLVKVEATGGGFLMIRYEVLDVLEKLHGEPQPWFCEPTIDGVHFGEDLAFGMRVKDAGFSVWAHRGVEVTHYKVTQIGPQPGSNIPS